MYQCIKYHNCLINQIKQVTIKETSFVIKKMFLEHPNKYTAGMSQKKHFSHVVPKSETLGHL
jgi:hypothetical protein